MRRILFVPLFALAFLAAFYGGFVVAFPGDAARERLAWEVSRATGGVLEIEAASLAPWRLTGLRLEDVAILRHPSASRGAGDDGEAGAQLLARLDRLAARAELLPLAAGEAAVPWRADLYGGRLSGRLALEGDLLAVRWEGQDVDLSRIPIEGADWRVDAAGTVVTDGDLRWSPEDFSTLEGEAELAIEDLVLARLEVMGMSLEDIVFTESELAVEASDKRLEVRRGRFVSDLLEAEVGGSVLLNRVPMRSRLKLTLELRLSEDYDKLAQVSPTMKQARDPEGVYHFDVLGTFQRPRMRPDRAAARGKGVHAPATRRATRVERPAPHARPRPRTVDSEEAARRREERRQRLLERKQRLQRERAGADEGPGLPPPPPDEALDPLPSPDLEGEDADFDAIEEAAPLDDHEDLAGGYVE